MSTAVLPDARPRHRAALALLAFAQFIIAMDYNIVFVALPEIGVGLEFSAQTLQWVVSAYAVAFGGFLLLGGRAGDLLGRRRTFVAGMTLFALSSLVGGLAATPWLLVVARAVQGLGAALLFPAALSLINTTFAEGRERNPRARRVERGLALGALFGGVLTSALGWESVFLVNVPLCAAGALAALRLIQPDPVRESGRAFDLPGAVTATAGVTLVVFALVEGPEMGWGQPAVVVSAVLGVVLLVAFARIESRSADPVMPLRLLRHRDLVVAMAVTAVFMATFGVQYYFLTLYLQDVHGYSALATGLAFLPQSLLTTAGTLLGERMVGRFGVRNTLVTGLLLGAVGMVAPASGMAGDGTYAGLLAGIAVLSLGQGLTWTGMWIAAGTGVEHHEQGVASGMASTAQQVGGSAGLAVLVAVAGAAASPVGGLRTAVFATAGVAAVGALAALAFRRREDRALR
ncbi:LOW QUALITY PROTEIN: putative MFS family arabinose efflux permease [Saccharopolyspora erythraea NRRL 2338]|nr:LOW QUALITY PROTEIN: putative MFS family arabinose efflux permease [Saccharopolyspora erythraea NRRL 2338]